MCILLISEQFKKYATQILHPLTELKVLSKIAKVLMYLCMKEKNDTLYTVQDMILQMTSCLIKTFNQIHLRKVHCSYIPTLVYPEWYLIFKVIICLLVMQCEII